MLSKVAVIVVGWNNKDLLEECFRSALEQTYKPLEIYYVDNGSKDNSVEYVKQHFPEIKLVLPGYNTGFAKGNNLAIVEALKDSEVEHIVLLNSDARLEKDWVEKIVEFVASKPKAALLQGTTLDYYDHSVIDSTHVYVSHNGQGTQGNWRHYDQAEIGPKKVFGVNAAACLITRSFVIAQPFEQLLDERMFMYLEDVDLIARATVMGWDNYLVPGARAYHMGSASSGKNPGFSFYMTFRNNSAVLFKNFPLTMIIKMSPAILRGDIDTIRTLRRMRKKQAFSKVIKGRLIGIIRLPLFAFKRMKIRKHSNIPDGYLWRLMKRGY